MEEKNIKTDDATDVHVRLMQIERENRRLRRKNNHLKSAIAQEKLAVTTILNQQKAGAFIHREQGRYLALLLANSPNIMLFLDKTCRVEFCTEYFIGKAGFKSSKDVLGHTLDEVFARFLDKTAHENLLKQSLNAIQNNTPHAFEASFCLDRESAPRDFAGLLVPMSDDFNYCNGLMLMFHDVTTIKRS